VPQNATPPLATLPDDNWFRDGQHSELKLARTVIGEPADRVRIAHLDTGFDPTHETVPHCLRRDLQRSFVDGDTPNDASDRISGVFTNLAVFTQPLEKVKLAKRRSFFLP
jgi:hypothetical protein